MGVGGEPWRGTDTIRDKMSKQGKNRSPLASVSCHTQISHRCLPLVKPNWLSGDKGDWVMQGAGVSFLRHRARQRLDLGFGRGKRGTSTPQFYKGNRKTNFHVPPTSSHNTFLFVDYGTDYKAL